MQHDEKLDILKRAIKYLLRYEDRREDDMTMEMAGNNTDKANLIYDEIQQIVIVVEHLHKLMQ